MSDNENKYWAFLSYSHQDNHSPRSGTPEATHLCWGDWLHDALKTFSIPAEFAGQINGRGEIIPQQIHPIYQAELELSADANLSASVRKALEQSICLVVICSPRSAKNLQVNETVRYFKQLGRSQHILPIVVAGEPNVSQGQPPGAAPENECLVPALRHPVQADGTIDTTRRAGKFIFVDARHGVDQREILAQDHRHAEADLELAKIQLIALLLGVGFNGLWWREQKRHFFDFAEARHQAREALNQIEEVQRQLQAAQQQTREAQQQALENQNLPRDVQSQIQEAQNQAVAAQNQTREVEKQLQEVQNKVRDTQAQLEEARQRAFAAETKVLETQKQTQEVRTDLEAARQQTRETQDTSSQLEEARQQAQAAHSKFLEAQSQVRELQNQARSAQAQLEEARQQVGEAQSQARAAFNQVEEIQNQTREAQAGDKAAQFQIPKIAGADQNARRLIKVFALLAVLSLMAAGIAASIALRQSKIAGAALAKATAETAANFDLAAGGFNQERIRRVLQNMAGAEQAENQRHNLLQLAISIPPAKISEALKASTVILNDQQRSHFQKWLLTRLSWMNPAAAMTAASTVEGDIVNEAGQSDSRLYFQLTVLDNWMKTDLLAAFHWIWQLPDAGSRQRALDKIILWAQSSPDAEAQNKSLEICTDELAKTDLLESLTLAGSIPEGVWRNTVMARLCLNADPFAACPWINAVDLPPSMLQRQKTPALWLPFLLNLNCGSPTIVPVETEMLSITTNDPVQIKPAE